MLARVVTHVLARVIMHVHDYYLKTCIQDGSAQGDTIQLTGPFGGPRRACKLNRAPLGRGHPGYYRGSENIKQIEEAKMVGYKLSKNNWVTPSFVIFRSVREKLRILFPEL